MRRGHLIDGAGQFSARSRRRYAGCDAVHRVPPHSRSRQSLHTPDVNTSRQGHTQSRLPGQLRQFPIAKPTLSAGKIFPTCLSQLRPAASAANLASATQHSPAATIPRRVIDACTALIDDPGLGVSDDLINSHPRDRIFPTAQSFSAAQASARPIILAPRLDPPP